MVAYSFKARFAPPILAGLQPGPLRPGMKRQTVRADRKRHARPGEDLQLYTGMRTRNCTLLGVPVCTACDPVSLALGQRNPGLCVGGRDWERGADALDAFARADGFPEGWDELVAFWAIQHAGIIDFSGSLVRWTPKEAGHG